MSLKFLLFVLGTLLLVQCTLANVIGKKSEPEEDTSPDAAALDFFGNSLFRSFYLVDKTYDFSQSILAPAVASFTASKDDTQTPLQKRIQELKEYLQKSHDLVADAEHKNKSAFLQGLDKIFEDIKETEKTTSNFSEFESSVLKAIENFKKETYKVLNTVATHIVADAEDFWEEMGASKREEKQKFHATLLKLKTETDSDKKAELIAALLESAN